MVSALCLYFLCWKLLQDKFLVCANNKALLILIININTTNLVCNWSLWLHSMLIFYQIFFSQLLIWFEGGLNLLIIKHSCSNHSPVPMGFQNSILFYFCISKICRSVVNKLLTVIAEMYIYFKSWGRKKYLILSDEFMFLRNQTTCVIFI